MLAGVLSGCAGGSTTPKASATPSASASTYTGPPSVLPVPGSEVTLSTGPAPWLPPAVIGNGKDSAAYVAAAGLPYDVEMLQVHYHAHLDINVDGKPVAVPPYLGFVTQGRNVAGLAPLHTHDSSGIIHIENNVPANFLLGQVFVEWGVRLTATCVGGYCADATHELAVFVNGARYSGDPSRIVLAKHQEIAIEYGGKGKLPPPPTTYVFRNGL
ncbi:MAG: hypothetical protein QOG34_244 [Frankiaceae bacterium]|nr:hypothetical protein [Frankiaceae bacterium]